MKYLILTADYDSFLYDEFDIEFDYLDLNLPDELVRKLEKWHEDYLPMVQLNPEERLQINSEILKLDERGIELAKEIKFQLGEVKVKYYSEGLLKTIMY